MTALLEVRGLAVQIRVRDGLRTVVRDASLTIEPGEIHGLVGESGSGKTMTARAIARLLPSTAEVGGEVRFDGEDVLSLAGRALRSYRSYGVAVIFQDPRAHVNPVRTIDDFLTEAMRTVLNMSWTAARRRGLQLLQEVGVLDGERLLRQYPHQLSGGLLQRVMIAAALAAEPKLLIADEPTTALDVSTQAEVMATIQRLRDDRGLAVLLISHDLELAATVCDRISVMYGGSVLEHQAAPTLFAQPLHPYSAALLAARPSLTGSRSRLATIPGRPLAAYEITSAGCVFADRCLYVKDLCRRATPPPTRIGDALVRCVRVHEIRGQLSAPVAESC